jgi:FkbM family methyltransferase
VRRLPNGAKIYLSPDSQLKYLKRSFDSDLLALADQHSSKDAVIWDIGANCGVLSFAPREARQIVAVEADPFLVSVLQESARVSKLPVTIIPAAVYNETGMAEFVIAKRGRASNHLVAASGHSQSGGERSRIMVPTITLDQLLDRFDSPTLVKIDVEGAEVEVLSGGERLLKEARPAIYFEATARTYPRCAELLQSAGYILQKRAEMNWMATPTSKP